MPVSQVEKYKKILDFLVTKGLLKAPDAANWELAWVFQEIRTENSRGWALKPNL